MLKKIKIKKDGNFYIATCPVWLDCYAQGKTLSDAVSEVKAVASNLISLYKEKGMLVPLT